MHPEPDKEIDGKTLLFSEWGQYVWGNFPLAAELA